MNNEQNEQKECMAIIMYMWTSFYTVLYGTIYVTIHYSQMLKPNQSAKSVFPAYLLDDGNKDDARTTECLFYLITILSFCLITV